MFSSTDKVKHNFTNSSFIAASLVLLLILFIRVTRGLDLTDEMQYYGQIKGLIETGKLFSNDLFVQQTVYILFYPVLSLYHSIFGFDCLVIFSRLLMSALTIGVFAYAFQKLVSLDFAKWVAAFTALSLTFAIPYHGIFAPSYNTISQVLWIIAALKFIDWRHTNSLSWGVIIVLMLFAHPTSAVTLALLISVRCLVERQYLGLRKLMLSLVGLTLVALLVGVQFASVPEYLASLRFSSGYGVGAQFFSNFQQPVTLALIYIMFGCFILLNSWKHNFNIFIPVLLAISISISIFLFGFGYVQWGYSPYVVIFLSLSTAIAYGWGLSNADIGDLSARNGVHWGAVFVLVYATTLGVTSGNGIGQATGAFMVGLPLLLAVAVRGSTFHASISVESTINIVSTILVTIQFAVHWSRFAYREESWWKTSEIIQTVAEFRYIKTSPVHMEFIYRMQNSLRMKAEGKRTLLVSEYPALYFALEAKPETCMLYMHSISSDKSEAELLNCLNKKSPDVIIDISPDNNYSSELRVKKVMDSYRRGKSYNCETDPVRIDTGNSSYPTPLKMLVCKKA